MRVTKVWEDVMERITKPPTREEFEREVAKFCFPEALAFVMLAWDWCGLYHGGETREDGTSYQDHPRAAAWILIQEARVRDPETIMLEILHDVCEIEHMAPPTHEMLCQAFGYRVAHKLRALTKVPGQDVQNYSRQVFAGGTKAVIAKFGDRLHNLRTLGACSKEKQRRVKNDTHVYYDPYSGEYQQFFRDVSPNDERRIMILWTLMEEELDKLPR